jgi:hypothetical protein
MVDSEKSRPGRAVSRVAECGSPATRPSSTGTNSARGHITVTRDRSFAPTLAAFFGATTPPEGE